jgi:hypothetical protein
MTRDEKHRFIHDLTEAVTLAIIAKIDDMPEEWDGIELRRYIADRFEEEAPADGSLVTWRRPVVWGFSRDRRLRAYHAECIARNL